MAVSKEHYGIDLGTTHTVLVKYNPKANGESEYQCIPLPNEPINKYADITKYTELLPSVVYYGKDGRAIVGEYAKNAIQFAPERVYYNSKIDLGSHFVREEEILHTPEDIAVEILKVCFQEIYKRSGTAAIIHISVPAAFSDDKKKETKNAAEKANISGNYGFKGFHLTEEPYAALVHLTLADPGFKEKISKKEKNTNIIVIDIGGGTMDIIACGFTFNNDERTFYVNFKGTPAKHDEFGGAKFDHTLMEKFMADVLDYYYLTKEDVAKPILEKMEKQFILYAEDAKKFLCTPQHSGKSYQFTPDLTYANLTLPEGKTPFSIELTKKEMDKTFRGLLGGLKHGNQTYDSIQYYITKYLKDNLITTDTIDYICLTGGMSSYDKVVEAVKDTINKEILIAAEPLLCTAKGIVGQFSVDDDDYKQFSDIVIPKTAEQQNPEETLAEPKEKRLHFEISEPNQIGNSYFIDIDGQFPVEIISKNHVYPCGIEKSEIQLQTTSQSQLYLVLYEGNSIYDPKLKVLHQRKIDFHEEFHEILEIGTPVDISFEIDNNKIITFYGSIAGKAPIKFCRKGSGD